MTRRGQDARRRKACSRVACAGSNQISGLGNATIDDEMGKLVALLWQNSQKGYTDVLSSRFVDVTSAYTFR